MEHRPLNEKHVTARRDIYAQLLGTLAEHVAPAVAEVEKKTGIRPPAWFNAAPVSIDDARQLAVAASRRPL